MRRAAAGVLAGALVLALGLGARAQDDMAEMYGFDEGGGEGDGGGLEFRWGGKIQSDLRWRVNSMTIGGFYREMRLEDGIARNENIVGFKGEAIMGDVAGVLEIDFVWMGIPDEIDGIGDLSLRQVTDPYRLEAHAAYVEVYDFLLEGLDLRVGQQLVLWGKADQFNPTNTLNPNDVEDPLLFGEQRANLMVRLDYNFWDQWTLSGVLVPIFKPALLPSSASLGLMYADRIPVLDEQLRYKLHTEKALAEHYFDTPTITSAVTPFLPDKSAQNMQFAFRIAGTVLEQDIAFSYYRGRSDRPQAFENYSTQQIGAQCDPADGTHCIDGLINTEAKLNYPRMEVVGFNIAGEIPLGPINPLGYRLELGVYLPRRTEIRLYQETIDFTILKYAEGEYDYDLDGQPGGPLRPTVIASTPFAKWTLGLDYSIGRHVMLIGMWIHGMFDEFGAGDWMHEGWDVRKGWVTSTPDEIFSCVSQEQLYLAMDGAIGRKCDYQRHAAEILRPKIGDYLMLDVDLKFLDDRALLRLVGIFDLVGVYEERWVWNDPDDHDPDGAGGRRVRTHHGMFTSKGFSASLFPELNYNVGSGLDISIGGLINLGKEWSKFGDPAAGGSMIWTRARFQY